MGNKLCKKKTDAVDNSKSPKSLDKIINRLHLRPNSWKSDSHLNQKQVNRYNMNSAKDKSEQNPMIDTQPFSKSSDWSEVTLEVAEKDEPIHLQNPKLSLIFDNEKTTPVPPPRKHKKNLREKLEAVAKSSLQAFQPKKPVEEPLCVKKIINPTCPVDEHDCAIHNRDHKHETRKNEINNRNNEQKTNKGSVKLTNKEAKRRKNLSVISLPNYNELKLTVATFDDIDKKPEQGVNGSINSLPNEPKKLTTTTSTGKLEICMTRCRSFGSLLPQQLLDKWRVRKIPTDIESDDSFGALEDWDLRIIEHYNPNDASLPRPRKLKTDEKNVLDDVESLIVNEEEAQRPIAPVRRSESLLKKINREAQQSAKRSSDKLVNHHERPLSVTPPPSPNPKPEQQIPYKSIDLSTEENGVPEHSNLMRILEKYSMMDKQKSIVEDAPARVNIQQATIIPQSKSIVNNLSDKTRKDIANVESFLNIEKSLISKEV